MFPAAGEAVEHQADGEVEAVVAGFFASQSAFVLVINLLLQLGLHWTPLHTGLTLIPWAFGTAVAVLLAGAVLESSPASDSAKSRMLSRSASRWNAIGSYPVIVQFCAVGQPEAG